MIGGQFLYQKSNAALPDYFRPYGGGASRLRGHEEGKYLGDKFFLATTEIRIPFSAHDSEAIYGIHSFYNVGKIAFHGEDLSDATLRKGAGFGAFFFMHGSGFRLDIGNDLEGNYAVHFGSDFTF